MDTAKLSEVFATLKGLLSTHNSGRHWSESNKPRPKVSTFGSPQAYKLEVRDEFEILEVADETKLFACGLENQPRLGRRSNFACSAHIADERYAQQCLGGMPPQGRVVCLDQTLLCNSQSLVGTRTLLTPGEHVGRKVRLGWKLLDGLDYQLVYQLPKPFTIERHLSTCVWLDRSPDPYEGAGYLTVIFEN